ncbi:hypothetical protein EPO04_04150 [Patescibacteria group bacterium]|nr:MAG: hypothetical protein EPO04_04150 [Patescibacteria group bacterium]
MRSNLVRWDFEVSVDIQAKAVNRASIQYTLLVRCPLCSSLHQQLSPVFSALNRANYRHVDERMKYRMVIKDDDGDIVEVIEWVTRQNIGHETRNFMTGTWNCSDCGINFGLTATEQRQVLKDVTDKVTVEAIDEEIIRLEKAISGDPATSRGHKKRYWYLMTT